MLPAKPLDQCLFVPELSSNFIPIRYSSYVQGTQLSLYALFQDGIVDPVDSTLRDFCGRCIREFLKWSIKQTPPQQQENSPVNTKSLFKRLYSFALHPNAFKRLGASLAFNNIYREFRCVSSLSGVPGRGSGTGRVILFTGSSGVPCLEECKDSYVSSSDFVK